MAKRNKLSEEQLKLLENLSGMRMPVEQIAHLLGMKEGVYREMLRTDATMRKRVAKGRSEASFNFRKTAFQRALGQTAKVEVHIHHDEKGKETRRENKVVQARVEPSDRMIEFWGKTQEGFKSADRLELIGENGGPIKVRGQSREELLAELKDLEDYDPAE